MSAPTVHIRNDAAVPRHASPEQAPPERRHGYEHLAPLFAERAALPDGHPRRELLRAQLVAGICPWPGTSLTGTATAGSIPRISSRSRRWG